MIDVSVYFFNYESSGSLYRNPVYQSFVVSDPPLVNVIKLRSQI